MTDREKTLRAAIAYSTRPEQVGTSAEALLLLKQLKPLVFAELVKAAFA